MSQILFNRGKTLGDSKTVIYTFFGDNSGVFTEEMLPYMGINSAPTLNAPFIVQIELSSSYYFSNSQPPPIEYYIKEKNRWIMFSMDFLNGRYAQTLVCNFENPSSQLLGELFLFLIGVFFTLSITFGFEAFASYEKRKEDRNKDPE